MDSSTEMSVACVRNVRRRSQYSVVICGREGVLGPEASRIIARVLRKRVRRVGEKVMFLEVEEP